MRVPVVEHGPRVVPGDVLEGETGDVPRDVLGNVPADVPGNELGDEPGDVPGGGRAVNSYRRMGRPLNGCWPLPVPDHERS